MIVIECNECNGWTAGKGMIVAPTSHTSKGSLVMYLRQLRNVWLSTFALINNRDYS
jgi:hypothetical protein